MFNNIYNSLKRSSPTNSNLFWIGIGFSAQQIIRLSSNLIITRILTPDLFGVMAIIHTIITAMGMLTDVGVRGKLINHENSEEHYYRNTAWTFQIFKGFALFIIVLIIAKPLENFYEVEGLAFILIITATSLLFSGATSLNLIFLSKHMEIKRLTIIQLSTQIVGVSCIVFLAYMTESIWALVAGAVISSIILLIISHTIIPNNSDRLHWDSSAAKDIFSYGKWILISTAITFFTLHGDRLIMGKMISLSDLGVYSIAAMLAMLIRTLGERFSSMYLRPSFARSFRDNSPQGEIIAKRYQVILIGLAPALIFALFGDTVITALYDARYVNAGWMLQLLSLAGFYRLFDVTLTQYILARNDSYSIMLAQAVKGIILLVLMIFLGLKGGLIGVLIAIAITPILAYIAISIIAYKHKYKLFWLDFLIMATFTLIVVSVWRINNNPIYHMLCSFFSS
jgi:O-antigen/teichoic acid export membrane protein